MKKTLAFLSLALAACGGSTTSTPPDAGAHADAAVARDAAVAGACAKIASTYTFPAGTPCASASGSWSAYTADETKMTYTLDCNQPASVVYNTQAEFDANEGTSGATGVTIVSHEDFVRTATCASGSIDYTASPSPKTTILFVWVKTP